MSILAAATDSEWTHSALAELDEVLIDHAHCEKKAAGMAVRLIFRYPEHGFLLAPLSRLAREELQHFEQVLGLLERRGLAMKFQRPSPYAGLLRRDLRTHEPARLIDTLLCCALIEVRSCERFELLAESVDDSELAALWKGLVAAEARHHRVYVELACRLAEESEVRSRLAELARREAEIVSEASFLPRMHG
jgi:tRNA-(ms[2]io[6]A)-hydroxylase